jgi:hypothetical protein
MQQLNIQGNELIEIAHRQLVRVCTPFGVHLSAFIFISANLYMRLMLWYAENFLFLRAIRYREVSRHSNK